MTAPSRFGVAASLAMALVLSGCASGGRPPESIQVPVVGEHQPPSPSPDGDAADRRVEQLRSENTRLRTEIDDLKARLPSRPAGAAPLASPRERNETARNAPTPSPAAPVPSPVAPVPDRLAALPSPVPPGADADLSEAKRDADRVEPPTAFAPRSTAPPVCDELVSDAMTRYEQARRVSQTPSAEDAFSAAAAALDRAMIGCGGERPPSWHRAAMALANSRYYTRHYADAALWYRKAIQQAPPGAMDTRPAYMAELLATCSADTMGLDHMRRGSLRLVGSNGDPAASRDAAGWFAKAAQTATCPLLKQVSSQSANTLRQRIGGSSNAG